MDDSKPASSAASHPFRWFPEFLGVLHKRSQAQSRLLGAALLVGVVAGLGAVAFARWGEVVVRASPWTASRATVHMGRMARPKCPGPGCIPRSNRSSPCC